ncbi:EAL domain-containing protein [Thiomicrorhabdus sediminis]|uniref:EAL domain-containing response regulator n=1 Tax=Thiomicrorhabdus sediminis TaxID=2580412 RepID=A0A4P9K7K8_9GAMM|nr:EAL domain-containing response regulator [Thiomicrorhabdus sediminis]QCU90227.1 EAL domain-containing response regulator [Thiomicrorhabdus sediminis]
MSNEVSCILIIEDSKSQRDFLEMICLESGVSKILCAEHGEHALELIEQHNNIDIVLCDLEMPVMNGIDFINAIPEHKRSFGLVVMSSRELNLIKGVELMAQSAGISTLGAFAKPFVKENLDTVIADFKPGAIKIQPGARNSKQDCLSESDLQKAIAKDEFCLHFQPKIRFDDYKLVGFEALLRWNHPVWGMVSPADFVPALVRFDLIDEVTLWIVEAVAKSLAKWNQVGLQTNVAINLSSRSFHDASFAKKICEGIDKYGILSNQVSFEVTETEVIKDMTMALSILNNLKLSGFDLALDDFGTGESSLNRLTQIPFSELKLDRSLINGIAKQPSLQAAVESMISMCRKMSIKVVAEGVEEFRDWSWLCAYGCDICQGFLVGRPMPEEAVLEWHQSHMTNIANASTMLKKVEQSTVA